MLCLIAVTFLPVLQNGFISSDEMRYITNNPLIRDLSAYRVAFPQ